MVAAIYSTSFPFSEAFLFLMKFMLCVILSLEYKGWEMDMKVDQSLTNSSPKRDNTVGGKATTLVAWKKG